MLWYARRSSNIRHCLDCYYDFFKYYWMLRISAHKQWLQIVVSTKSKLTPVHKQQKRTLFRCIYCVVFLKPTNHISCKLLTRQVNMSSMRTLMSGAARIFDWEKKIPNLLLVLILIQIHIFVFIECSEWIPVVLGSFDNSASKTPNIKF